MIYGTTTLEYESGSLQIVKSKAQIVRHYVGTDIANVVNLGKKPTIINCMIMVKTDSERILVEQLLHTDVERNLYLDNHFYKRVVAGESFNPQPFVDGICFIPVEFIALDPIPYDTVTEVALY